MLLFDRINAWSEIKLEIIKEYAKAYSVVFSAKRQSIFEHIYIDAFAGAGLHISRTKSKLVPGNPLNAIDVEPPFKEYHFVELDDIKVENLRALARGKNNIFIYHEDCNKVLINEVFPRVKYEEYRRALCLLDPYGLHLNWEVIQKAGKMGTIDIFLNFPIMDMNRNAFWRNPEGLSSENIDRMNAFWGDESWRNIVYQTQEDLFGEAQEEKVATNFTIAEAFRKRLMAAGGFKYVPEPLPMRNSIGSIVYYLFFASQKEAGKNIAVSIFNKYKNKGLK